MPCCFGKSKGRSTEKSHNTEKSDGEKLHWAACSGNKEEVRELLDKGVKWDAYKVSVSYSDLP